LSWNGTEKGKDDDGEDNSREKKKTKKHNASKSEPLCVIHNNGVIEYTTKADAHGEGENEEDEEKVLHLKTEE